VRFFRRCHFTPGELSRVRQIVRDSGRTLILPCDQFIEHDYYAIESAGRMATEMGATIIKANPPKAAPEGFVNNRKVPAYYRDLEKEWAQEKFEDTLQERARRVVAASQGIPVLFSGGSKVSDEDLLWRAGIGVNAGGIGFIFGRDMWKRENASAMQITGKIKALLDKP